MLKLLVLCLCVFGIHGARKYVPSPNEDWTCELCDYVYREDSHYTWSTYREPVVQDGFTTHFLNMTSQKWYDENLTDYPVWWHYINVHIPHEVRFSGSAFMYIGGRSNTNSPPDISERNTQRTGEFARDTGIVAATLYMIPNQPLCFENETGPQGNCIERVEDDLISWTWRRFLDLKAEGIHEPEIVARMPMCKGSVRAMDAISEFVLETDDTQIDSFMIAGESKRGWTTWLTGAIDDRVIAMAPVVLSCLNMNINFHHYYQSFGGWPYYFFDYWNSNITAWIDTDEMAEMEKIVDPYSYRHMMLMPKIMISAASDEFFLLDDSHYFWDDLEGENHIWILEDTGHWMSNGPMYQEYWEMMQTFYVAVLDDYPRPDFTWQRVTYSGGGAILLHSPTEEPLNISCIYAPSIPRINSNNTARRDWRLNIFPDLDTDIEWFETPVENQGEGNYRVDMSDPDIGFLAFFMKVVYPGPDGRQFILTSEAHVIPEEFPFEDCSGADCLGVLV